MALFIGLATFISGGYTGDVIRWDLYEDSTGVLVDTHSEPGPHGTVYEFAFSNNIRDIPYRIELYDVPPGASVGNIIKSWVVTPTTSTIQLEDDIEIIVGHGGPYDPNDQDSATPVIPILAGGREYNVMKRMDGQLLSVREPEFTPDTVNGGFALNSGLTFAQDDVYIIKIKPVLIINPPGSVQAGFYKAVELITADRTVTSADAGKLFIVEQSVKVITITMPALAAFPDDIPLFIEVVGSDPAAINCVVKATGAEVILNNGFNDGSFIFSRFQSGSIIKKGTTWFGANNNSDAANRGQWSMCNWMAVNRVFAQGQEANAADYPGLIQALTKFPAGAVVTTLSSWQFQITSSLYYRLNRSGGPGGEQGSVAIFPNKGKFALYSVAGVAKIRFPDWRNMFQRGLKNILGGSDSTRAGGNISGGFQQSAFPEHDHYMWAGERGSVNLDNGGGLGRGDNNIKDFLTYKSGGSSVTNNSQQETRPDNIGQVPAVII